QGRPAPQYFQRACASRDGGLWLVGDGRLRRLTHDGRLLDLGLAPWGWNSITALLETKAGDLLAGTLSAGLFLLAPDGTHWQFTRQSGMSHDWVRSLCEDREGSVWVGTGGGLNAMRIRRVE